MINLTINFSILNTFKTLTYCFGRHMVKYIINIATKFVLYLTLGIEYIE